MDNKNNVIVWIAIVLAVVIFLVFLTLNGKESKTELTSQTEEQEIINNLEEENNMQQEIPEGIEITVEKEGEGEITKTGDIITVNYIGRLRDGTVFDSNILPEFGHMEPFKFQLGVGMVIQGWDIGVAGMKVGEKRILNIAPEYAYGDRAVGEVIPANATLIFEVELLEITNQ